MYSADYPEKWVHWHTIRPLLIDTETIGRVLLSTIKSNAEHPCPRCLVKKVDTIKMGTRSDMRKRHVNIRIDDHIRRTTVDRARRLVFEQGIPLSSTRLKKVLGNFSGVPTHGSPYVSWISWPILTSIPLERFLDQAQQPWS
jgi:hypothetical protein